MNRWLAYLLALVCMAACATNTGDILHDARFELVVKDDPSNERFLLSLVSEDERRICLSDDQWPRSNGALRSRAGTAVLVTSQERIPSTGNQLGHCIGPQCVHVIEPGGELKGHVNYSEFDMSQISSADDKKLEFNVMPWTSRSCRKGSSPAKQRR